MTPTRSISIIGHDYGVLHFLVTTFLLDVQ